MYLDHAATTPVAPEVIDAMVHALRETYGNAASVHREGQRARRAVEDARERVAWAVGARPRQVVFTSGATEADNHALRGVAALRAGALVTSPLEHAAVRSTALALADAGRSVVWLEPDARGAIAPEALEAGLAALEGGPPALVALMLVNNETGVRSDVPALARVAHAAGALFACDAVQAFGFEPIDVGALGADLVALSAHKVRGPKGVGALIVREGLELPPLLYGGEQEGGRRPGTHDTPAIVGFGVAAERAARDAGPRAAAVAAARDAFEAAATEVPGVSVNGGEAPRGPKHSNLRVEGVDGEALLLVLDDLGLRVSAGSACAAGSVEPSHVLLAMGLDAARARASVRFSFGEGIDAAEARAAAERFALGVERCRRAAA